MAYIDADKLITFANNHKNKMIDANDIARFPTADVVPKSEVEKLIAEAKQEVAREIFEEIDKGFAEMYPLFSKVLIINFLAELKKKHTEEKQ